MDTRLAEIKRLLALPRPPGSATDPITGRLTRDDLEWLVGEVERLREHIAGEEQRFWDREADLRADEEGRA